MYLRLTREGLYTEELNGQQVWPLKVTAAVIDAAMPSSKIFVYHATMGDDAYQGDLFECVASLEQYNDLPENAAVIEDDVTVVPYYRLDVLNFACRSPEEAEQLWSDIQEDVIDLVNNYIAFNNLRTLEVVEI
jgi:hypothetical protein